jgi:hypothetical protein
VAGERFAGTHAERAALPIEWAQPGHLAAMSLCPLAIRDLVFLSRLGT